MPKLEIAVTSLEEAANAQAGGADSIEISYDLSVGGLTPDLDLVRAVCAAVPIDVHVIVRPHARDFCYTPDEIDLILEQTRMLASIPIRGIVFGALDANRRVDIPLMHRVVKAAAPLPITLHRALDESANPEEALQALSGVIPRVLTSGPAPTAWEGRKSLQRWVQDFGAHIEFVAAGSLTAAQLAEYAAYVQAYGYHLGSAARTNGVVDVDQVRRLRAILGQ
ncbi:MAG: hypothetical protein K8I30_14260 [Anaerolineae bacterium]|nr:hypothetical protein [Anaerolineae bacterium]